MIPIIYGVFFASIVMFFRKLTNDVLIQREKHRKALLWLEVKKLEATLNDGNAEQISKARARLAEVFVEVLIEELTKGKK